MRQNTYIGLSTTSLFHCFKELKSGVDLAYFFEIKNDRSLSLGHTIWSCCELKLLEEWFLSNLGISLSLEEFHINIPFLSNNKTFLFGRDGLSNIREILRKLNISFELNKLEPEKIIFDNFANEFIRQQVVFNKYNRIEAGLIHEQLPNNFKRLFSTIIENSDNDIFWRDLSALMTGFSSQVEPKESEKYFFLLRVLIGVSFFNPSSLLEMIPKSKLVAKSSDNIQIEFLGSNMVMLKVGGYEGSFTSLTPNTFASGRLFTIPRKGLATLCGTKILDKRLFNGSDLVGLNLYISYQVREKNSFLIDTFLPSRLRGHMRKRFKFGELSILPEETGCFYGVMPHLSYLFSTE